MEVAGVGGLNLLYIIPQIDIKAISAIFVYLEAVAD